MRVMLIAVVAGVHVVVIGGALLIQGCGTTRGPEALPTEHTMPPAVSESEVLSPVPAGDTYRPMSIKDAASAASPAPVVRPAPVSSPRPVVKDDSKTYVVGKGDSLSVIAKRFGITQADIMLLNNLSNPNVLRLGQKLKLPASVDITKPRPVTKKASPASSSSAVQATAAVSGSTGDYVVKSGDSLSRIAQRNGTTVKALKETNNLKNDKLVVGQKLVLPTGQAKAPVAPALPTPPIDVAPVTPVAPVAPVVEDSALMMVPPVEPVLTTPDLNALPPEQPPMPAGSRTTHTVKVGDTILTVSSEYNVSISKLRKANNLTSDTLVPGRVLLIPAAD